MHIKVNGEEREVPSETTLEGLVRLLALVPERLAVELNYEVVRRAEWPQRTLNEGDRVEIVHFVGGGGGVGRRVQAAAETEPRAAANAPNARDNARDRFAVVS